MKNILRTFIQSFLCICIQYLHRLYLRWHRYHKRHRCYRDGDWYLKTQGETYPVEVSTCRPPTHPLSVGHFTWFVYAVQINSCADTEPRQDRVAGLLRRWERFPKGNPSFRVKLGGLTGKSHHSIDCQGMNRLPPRIITKIKKAQSSRSFWSGPIVPSTCRSYVLPDKATHARVMGP